ncbi:MULTISPECIES: efflux transporter outer membrane subunit [unclassified Polaromonas]|uniref:efflux transporter outer membrane subunit n=1 Tax=unclassified Polaromonas TaxID=2638319 RepID=UPI0018CAE3A7|nr:MULTISPECIES: efflux transporter outer membrane subunit [unclassified Polaromonas]MBG6073458.1 NodT family efflux transporter outer membrane factor (OMF) lipoprotein [Polaromonas sp. CG_9.7]MBG6115496.1 NodT family efflux transporter outer membrane factor (OMF) lipoprotein [Polaromonas sp. CG_9.2]
MKPHTVLFCVLLPLGLGACATAKVPGAVSAPVPAQWSAPLPPQAVPAAHAGLPEKPHHGSLTDLTQWWQQQGDPLLVELITAAQAVSPTVATARSRIEQSRATRVAAGAALGPSLDASASVNRGRSLQSGGGADLAPIVTTTQGGLQASWEIDVFGGNRASRNAADERLAGAEAQWHDARVSVAAEVANQYYSLRSCDQLAQITRTDATSRQETARLSGLSTRAGFTAPATDALARASAAEASGRATQQSAQCELDLKALVALSGLPESDLKQKVALAQYPSAQSAIFSIASVPADALAQRPDVFSAARDVAAASADVGSADAQRYPRLSLGGSIGASNFRSGGLSASLTTWSIGPLALSLPLFDGGRRAADVQAAQARYDEAAAIYRARVRQAVREVEEALVSLQSTAARESDAQTAVAGYRAAFTGTEARYQSGLASLVELEDARRSQLAAQTTQVSLQRERLSAWVALYRAMGGGWTPPMAQAGNQGKTNAAADATAALAAATFVPPAASSHASAGVPARR